MFPHKITVEEMLTPETIAQIGADCEDAGLCLVRVCGYVRHLEDENAKLNSAYDAMQKRYMESVSAYNTLTRKIF